MTTITERTEAPEAFVRPLLRVPKGRCAGREPDTVTIHYCEDEQTVRVSELGYFFRSRGRTGTGGAWLRSDPDALGVILAREEFLLEFDTEPDWPEGAEGSLDCKQEAEQMLRYVLTGKWGAWEERGQPRT